MHISILASVGIDDDPLFVHRSESFHHELGTYEVILYNLRD